MVFRYREGGCVGKVMLNSFVITRKLHIYLCIIIYFFIEPLVARGTPMKKHVYVYIFAQLVLLLFFIYNLHVDIICLLFFEELATLYLYI